MTTLTDGGALLHAILDHPGEDDRRLVYADWLEEEGDPYADVIRRMMRVPGGVETYLPGHTLCFGRRLLFSVPDGMTLTFGRGFVESVRCPLAAWYGAACGGCGGTGRRPARYGPKEVLCQKCRCVGRGPVVAKAHPVTRVELVDRRPLAPRGTHPLVWIWRVDDGDWEGTVMAQAAGHPQSLVPPDIYALLDGYASEGDASKLYHSAEDAAAALSRALILWARAQP